ncbi:tryptophan-rich sensory protein [Flavobacteriaceae bacterium F89]|uniref:Tryptophan-rich sensory protein n=1 Tax=Cerina litoralis TaxID=2874477 RepID=A0AAE3ET21_9FLAO|nr:TspO/MBR family protein [Cerina litoralis]MCG2460647.1 tryptophan-rich sensory protein [Cerina litoralis]
MKKRLTYIAISVGICLLVGILSGIATQNSVDGWYHTLAKPSFIPPKWVFAPVWTVLYILMGISAGLVWAKGFYHIWVKTALYHFGLQLLLNALWTIVFFGFENPFWGMLIILNLLILLLFTMKWFNVVSKTAAYLLIPYFLWVCYATFLNYRIWEMN